MHFSTCTHRYLGAALLKRYDDAKELCHEAIRACEDETVAGKSPGI